MMVLVMVPFAMMVTMLVALRVVIELCVLCPILRTTNLFHDSSMCTYI